MIDFNKIWEEKCSKYNKEQISIFPPVKRIIVLGDIHGDYNMMIELLKLAKVIDDKDNWIGDETYVVQVGDQIDRCRPKIGSTCENDIIENDEDIKGNCKISVLEGNKNSRLAIKIDSGYLKILNNQNKFR
jgi:hypothetical protein